MCCRFTPSDPVTSSLGALMWTKLSEKVQEPILIWHTYCSSTLLQGSWSVVGGTKVTWPVVFTKTKAPLWSITLNRNKNIVQTWWHQDMDALSALLALYNANPSVISVDSPHKLPVMRSFDIFVAVSPEQTIEQRDVGDDASRKWRQCNEANTIRV